MKRTKKGKSSTETSSGFAAPVSSHVRDAAAKAMTLQEQVDELMAQREFLIRVLTRNPDAMREAVAGLSEPNMRVVANIIAFDADYHLNRR